MKILVVGAAWVGDMVMSQSLFQVLHDKHSDLSLDVLAPEWTRPLLERMPQVSEAHGMPLGHGSLELGVRRKLGKHLKSRHYDQAIVLPNSFKSALVPWFAGIPLRTGWNGEMRLGLLNDRRKLNKQALPLMVQRFVALAHPAGIKVPPECPDPVLKANAESTPALLEMLGLSTDKPVVVFCPGAEYGPSKQWPASYFGELADICQQQGKQVWITGSTKDQQVAEEIRASAGNSDSIYNLTGKTSLGEVIDLMSLATAVVSNDSGLMHVAAALSRPVVAIYGSTSPEFTPPLGKSVKILVPSLDCSPCFARECPLVHHNCMKQTIPVRVSKALQDLENATLKLTPAD